MTISLDVTQGSVLVYGSNKIQNPNGAFHDFMLFDSQRKIFVNKETFSSSSITKRQIKNSIVDITIYISIQGRGIFNNFTLNTITGDVTTATKAPDITTLPTIGTTKTRDTRTAASELAASMCYTLCSLYFYHFIQTIPLTTH